MKPPYTPDDGGAHGPGLTPRRRCLFGDTPYVVEQLHKLPQAREKVAPVTAAAVTAAPADAQRCRTPPIPIPASHIPRTSSELQLLQLCEEAEWRERAMFQRLVSGMRERQARHAAVADSRQCRFEEALRFAGMPKMQPQRRGASAGEGKGQDEIAAPSCRTPGNLRAAAPLPMAPHLQRHGEKPLKTPTVVAQPQPQPHQNDCDRHRAQHLANILSKVVNEDWSVDSNRDWSVDSNRGHDSQRLQDGHLEPATAQTKAVAALPYMLHPHAAPHLHPLPHPFLPAAAAIGCEVSAGSHHHHPDEDGDGGAMVFSMDL